LQSAIKTKAAIYDTRFAFDYYRPLSDTRLLWGGRISILNRTPQEVAELLYNDMATVYPQLKGVKVDYAWSGLMSYAMHFMPQIGQLSNGMYYAMGFGGHGVAPTALAGELLAHSIIHGGKADLKIWERYGLNNTFGYLGQIGAQCQYWYLQMRDWVHDMRTSRS